MKKKISIMLAFICIAFCSCKKYLETTPKDFSSPEQFYSTASELENALNGVYHSLTVDGTFGRNLVIELANETDELFYKRTTLTVNPMLFNYDASNTVVAASWRALYDGVNRANYLLANIDKPVMDEKARKVIKGEALFLRSFLYFQLVSYWGDVPLMLTPTVDGNNVNVPRTPSAQVYAQILKDLTEAKDLVNPITAYTNNGKVSKTAVQAMLARVCLKMAGYPLKNTGKYVEARAWADSVITSGLHSLNQDYKQIFINHSADKYDLKECIWEVEFFGNNTGSVLLGARFSNQLAIRNTNADAGYGYAILGATPTLFNLYKQGDTRRDWNIATYGFVSNNSTDTVAKTDIYSRDAGKWRRQYETVRPLDVNWSSTNLPVLRYADVLLMFAEADNEIEGRPSQRAIDYVNLVRRRGYGKTLNGTGGVSEGVKSVTMRTGGTLYQNTTADPLSVEIVGGGGTGAKATATLTGSVVTAITVTSSGYGYSTAPEVRIRNTRGSGATATALLTPTSQADLLPAQFASATAFRTMIQEERSRELCYEGLRRADLIRWEKYLPALVDAGDYLEANAPLAIRGNQGVSAYSRASQKHLLLPIPSADIVLNKSLTQNPGW